MKKIWTIIIMVTLTAYAFAAGGQEAGAAGAESFKVGVAFNSIGSQELDMKEYLEGYVAKSLPVEFIFSEGLNDANAAMSFVENVYASGGTGIINFDATDFEQITAKCAELGMYIVNNNNYVPPSIADIPYNAASVGTAVETSARIFIEAIDDIINDGKSHNFLIVSGGSGFGNRQHLEVTMSVLQTLQKTYGLKYSGEIEKLGKSTAPTEIQTGKNVKIMIYPGYPNIDGYVAGISSILQTGIYDVILSTYPGYRTFSNAIDEVEKAFNKNIELVSVSPLTDDTMNAFTTLDSTGDSMLNSAVVKPATAQLAIMFTVLYNNMAGDGAMFKADGKARFYDVPMWAALSTADYERICKYDTSPETYTFTADELKMMIKKYNPDLTIDEFMDWISKISPKSIAQRRGL